MRLLSSYRIGTIAGVPIRIHVSLLLLLVAVCFISYEGRMAGFRWDGLVFALLIFLAVLLHEFGHVAAARYFDIDTLRVVLWAFGGFAYLYRSPRNSVQAFVIAFAGPLVNLILAAVFSALSSQFAEATSPTNFGFAASRLASGFAQANLLLGLFNLLPAFPLDGGHVFRAALTGGLGYRRATRITAIVSLIIAFPLGFVGLLINPVIAGFAAIIYFAARAELQTRSGPTESYGHSWLAARTDEKTY